MQHITKMALVMEVSPSLYVSLLFPASKLSLLRWPLVHSLRCFSVETGPTEKKASKVTYGD